MTWIKGNHTMQLGAYLALAQKNEANGPNLQVILSFDTSSPISTGNSFADLLTAKIANYHQWSTQVQYYNRYAIFEPYFQDDWRIGKKLTLNLGLRVSLFGTYRERYRQAYNFDPTGFDPSLSPGIDTSETATDGTLVPGFGNPFNSLVQCGASGGNGAVPAPILAAFPTAGVGGSSNPGCQQSHSFNPAPRIGFAWDPKGDEKMASYVYALPFFQKSGLKNSIFGGWQISGITIAQTGTPVSVINGTAIGDNAGVGNGVGTGSRPDLIGNPGLVSPSDQATSAAAGVRGQLFANPGAYALATGLTFGNVGRNTLYLPGRLNFDFGVFKQFPLRENMELQFRCSGSATKIVNRPNCLIPFMFQARYAQRANSHGVFVLDFSFYLVYVICIRYARPLEPQQTLRRRAQLPFPHCAAFLRSMVSSWHSLGTFGHLWQGELPLCPRGTA